MGLSGCRVVWLSAYEVANSTVCPNLFSIIFHASFIKAAQENGISNNDQRMLISEEFGRMKNKSKIVDRCSLSETDRLVLQSKTIRKITGSPE